MSLTEIEYGEKMLDDDELIIIRALCGAPEGDFISGSLLAEQLGVSRPAIHGKLEKLRAAGFEVEAVRNRGYRFLALPEVVHPALLRFELEQVGVPFKTFYFPAIDSTNSEAERKIASGESGPFAILSSCQTKGRGRLGRKWHSASAENLYISVLFEPNIPHPQLQHFTLWTGIYICRALQEFAPNAPLKIKWPNDLHCNGRKFAGMLTEAKMDADCMRSIIFGIGLNLNSNPNEYPEGIRQLATSLYAISGKEVSINQAAASVIQAVNLAYTVSIDISDTESLSEAWAPLNALENKKVSAIQNGKEVSGIASGIEDSGALILKMADGSKTKIHAGDITLKK